MVIYTREYNPFRLGPPVGLMGTEVEITERVHLDKGVVIGIIRNPLRQCWHAVEMTSGAMVGTKRRKNDVIDQVKCDLADATAKMVKEQIAEAVEKGRGVQRRSPDDFFGMFHQYPKRGKRAKK